MGVKKLRYFAGGEWLESKTEKYMDVYNPSTGEVMAQTPCCTVDEVEYAISKAKEAFKTGKTIRQLCEEKEVLPKDQLAEGLDVVRMTRPLDH